MKQTASLSLAFVLAATAAAPAATVLIDWSSAGTITNPAGDGKHWNSLGAVTVSPNVFSLAATALVDSTGASTGMTVAVDFGDSVSSSGSGFGGTGINGPSGADPFDEANAVNDGIFTNNNDGNTANSDQSGTATISFEGLATSTTYNISAIGGRTSNGVDGLITILTGTSANSTYSLLNDGTIRSFSVTSDASGVIVLNFSKSDSSGAPTNATFNAMSLTQVPEPSAALLGAVGLLALLRRRRF